jgi:hypothetical protein
VPSSTSGITSCQNAFTRAWKGSVLLWRAWRSSPFRLPRGEGYPSWITVLSAVGMSRRMMVSEALAS